MACTPTSERSELPRTHRRRMSTSRRRAENVVQRSVLDRAPFEMRLVRQMARERGMMTEDRVLDDRLSRPHGFEEVPEVRLHGVVARSAVRDDFRHGCLHSWLERVLLAPLLLIFFPMRAREAVGVVAWSFVHLALRG